MPESDETDSEELELVVLFPVPPVEQAERTRTDAAKSKVERFIGKGRNGKI